MRKRRARPRRALWKADRRQLRRSGLTAAFWLTGLAAAAAAFLSPEGTASPATGWAFLGEMLLCLFASGALIVEEKKSDLLPALRFTELRPVSYCFGRAWSAAVSAAAAGALPTLLSLCYTRQTGWTQWSALVARLWPQWGGAALTLMLGCLCFAFLGFLPAFLASGPSGFVRLALLEAALLFGPSLWELFLPLPEALALQPVGLLLELMTRPGETAARLVQRPEAVAVVAAFAALSAAQALACTFGLFHGKGGKTE